MNGALKTQKKEDQGRYQQLEDEIRHTLDSGRDAALRELIQYLKDMKAREPENSEILEKIIEYSREKILEARKRQEKYEKG